MAQNEKNITVLGYGSLLSEMSARRTCPNLKNFRAVAIEGIERRFNLATGFIRSASAVPPPSPRHAGVCAAYKKVGSVIMGVAFEVNAQDWKTYRHRERTYAIGTAAFNSLADGKWGEGQIVLGYESETDFRATHFNDPHNPVKEADYPYTVWREDILPYPSYLNYCLRAARLQSPAMYENFLDTTLLADGTTKMRDHVKANPQIFQAPLNHPIEPKAQKFKF